MKSRFWLSLAQIGVLVLATSIGAVSENPKDMNFHGLINDYTPSTAGGWEIRGVWSLKVNADSGTADFSAALDMEHSDLGVPNGNLADPKARNAHTHHVSLTGGTITPIANGFRVTGAAIITGNGVFPPPFGSSSTVQIDLTGGNSVPFSNIQITFGGSAVGHFGAQPVNGVVHVRADSDDKGDSDER
jgi:hypothetical protein